MIAVLFESKPFPNQKDAYLAAAARLGPLAKDVDGFLGIERFESISNPGKMLAISYWRDEEALNGWRNLDIHKKIQQSSRKNIFADYRVLVMKAMRDYSMTDRTEAPADSRAAIP